MVAGNERAPAEQMAYDDWLIAIAKELPPKKAAAIVADVTGLKKSAIYDRLLALQQVN